MKNDIPFSGYGWKIFLEDGRGAITFVEYEKLENNWIVWNKNKYDKNGSFCFFLDEKEANRICSFWNSLIPKTWKQYIVTPIKYYSGLHSEILHAGSKIFNSEYTIDFAYCKTFIKMDKNKIQFIKE